jgi:hypothetical protein
MNRIAAASCCLLLASPPATAQEAPPNPYENWGVCPFECCTYREWTADADIPVHAQRNDRSAVLFHVRPGESIQAVTGVVVTKNPARITIDHAVRDGFIAGDDQPRVSFKPGDMVHMLTPLGEGAYLFWYQGKVYQSAIDLAAMPGVEGKGMTLTWWKQVRNKAGKTGWTRSDHFQNADACG